ncbi:unnamed protein product [Kuraishia capsulata CBS 1993]|uniref:Ubiquinone biosynthesis protein n=1 Tax=Kuraishia capsulata CBS 1993 TaxID=1382522 RepID=W6MTM7_9ASCO|nr:uncharacterized protein KUCA_T00005811001 [Kuraishia capsulata CBS 1993]CDK29818.1 unnamed protein product [Kuraishia capsulata CBS 1993]
MLANSFRRLYHSGAHVNPTIITDTIQTKVLAAALSHVPTTGFTERSIDLALNDLSLSPGVRSSFNFSHGPVMSLVLHHLKTQRVRLQQNHVAVIDGAKDEYGALLKLVQFRLLGNEAVLPHYHEALATIILPSNVASSLEELHALSDDLSWYAGDASNDFKWYAKRLSLSMAYVEAELFQLGDKSEGFKDTLEFVASKLDAVDKCGTAYNDVEEWGVFSLMSFVNLLKSQLVRG